MARAVTLTIRRKDALLRKLGQIAPATQKALAESNKESAAEMVALARGFVPSKTGRLRDSIVATPPGQSPPDHAQGAGTVPEGAYAVTAGNGRVRYAHLVEYGTAPHVNAGWASGTQNPGTSARPYFWPSFRMIRKKMRSRATRAINKAIKAVAGK